MYGTQARKSFDENLSQFENDVNMYGTQACSIKVCDMPRFENDVNMYGTQAGISGIHKERAFENDVNLITLRYSEEVLSHFGTEPLFCYMTVNRRE